MIICHCMRVSDREIRQAARDGARSREDIGERCGAGACCGGCRPAIDEILAENGGVAVALVALRKGG